MKEIDKIRTVEIDNEKYFLLKDVCTVLNIGHTATVRKRLREQEIKKITIKDGMGRNQKANYINTDGLYSTISNSKKPEALKIARDMGIKVLKATKEQDHLETIIDAFSHLNFYTQYGVSNYKVDLYFPDLKLAVECDEFGHSKYTRKHQDEMRQKKIENELGCKFIRFNPDEEGFNIGKVINQIIKEMVTNERITESVSR